MAGLYNENNNDPYNVRRLTLNDIGFENIEPSVKPGDYVAPLSFKDIEERSESFMPREMQLGNLEPVMVTGEQYKLITDRLSKITDKEEMEQEEIRIASSLSFSRNFGLDYSFAYDNLEQLAMAWNGIKYKPTATNLQSILNSLKVGSLNNRTGNIGTRMMEIGPDDPTYATMLEEARSLRVEMEGLHDDLPRPWYVKAIKWTVENLPYIGTNILGTAEGAAAGRLALEGSAALAGKTVTNAPLAQIGEISLQGTKLGGKVLGKLNLPVAAVITGVSILDGFAKTKKVDQGNIFLDLIEEGIPFNIARNVADATSSVNQAIEYLGGLQPSYLKALGLDVDTLASRVLSRMYTKGRLSEIGHFLASEVIGSTEEASEDFIQTFTTEIGTDFAFALSGIERPEDPNADPTIVEAGKAFGQSFVVSLLLGLPANISNTRAGFETVRDVRNLALNVRSKETYDDLAAKIRPEDINEADWKKVTDEQYSKAKDILYKELDKRFSQQDLDTTLVDIDPDADVTVEDLENDDNVTGKEEENVTIDRLSNGKLYGYEHKDNKWRLASFGTGREFVYGSPKSKQSYGIIGYRTDDEGHLTITNVRMRKGYENLRQEMVSDFITRYPDMDISWETNSVEEESVKTNLINANPRGSEYGLNYGSSAHAADIQNVKTRMGNLFSDDEAENAALAEIIEMIGEREGLTGSEWLDRYVSFHRWTEEEQAEVDKGVPNGGHRQGSTNFYDIVDGVKAVVSAGKYANPTTFLHEMTHVLRRIGDNGNEFRAIFEKVRNDKNFQRFVKRSSIIKHKDLSTLFNAENWTTDDEEFFAQLGEAYWMSGQTMNSAISGFFSRLTRMFRNLYQAIRGTGRLNDEVVSYYDRLYGAGTSEQRTGRQEETVVETPETVQTETRTEQDVDVTEDTADTELADTETPTAEDLREETIEERATTDDPVVTVKESDNETTDTNTGDESHTASEWNASTFRDTFRARVQNEDVRNILESIPVRLHRMAGLVRISTGNSITPLDRYALSSRYENMTEEDAVKMQRNAESFEEAQRIYDAKRRKMENTSKRVTYTIGGRTYGEMARISSLGTFTPSQYISETGADPGFVLSVEADNVHIEGFEKPDPNMLWEGIPNRAESNPLFQTAYHGGANAFTQFDTEHIGTGEGNQAFGWGLYFSSQEAISRNYANVAVNKRKPLDPKNRNLYTVELPDTGYLEWYNPVSKEDIDRIVAQAEEEGLNEIVSTVETMDPVTRESVFTKTINGIDPFSTSVNNSGERLYHNIEYALDSDKAASEFLNRAGFVGIKYPIGTLHGGNRDNYDRGANYVIFNKNDIVIRSHELFQTVEDLTTSAEWQETETRLRANSANFDIAGRPLAPNGQISNLPYREWVTVRTQSFINWFGDWMNDPENASKVVDENGEPMIVYHGTMYDFSVFEAGQGAYYGAGLYFAGHREFAENWTHGMGRVVAAFLNLRNPNYVGTIADMDWSENNPDKIEAFAAGIRDYLNENHRPGDAEDAYNILSRMRVANVNTLLLKAQQLAHGPLFARSIESINRIFAETTGIDGFLVDYKDWQMALVSNQIKSVENIGTFDSSNPDIYYQTVTQVSIPETFSKELEDLSEKDINRRNDTITFSRHTPIVFTALGLPDLSVNMFKSKLARSLFLDSSIEHGHNDRLDKDIISKLATQLGTPIAVFDSATVRGSLVALYDIPDKKGSWLMASIAPNARAGRNEVNLITSLYGRNSETSYRKWIDQDLLKYVDDTKIEELVHRLQLPWSSSSLLSKTILKRSDIVKQIQDRNSRMPSEKNLFQTQAEKQRIDDEYFKAIERDDMETAQRIVDNQARLNGYISDDDYRMMHEAPYRDEEGFNQNISMLASPDSDLVPSDYWDHPERYGVDNEPGGMESFNRIANAIRKAKEGGKTPFVRMYRAVPADVREDNFRNGDWITPSRTYAEEHGRNHINGPYRIIMNSVSADDIFWNGDSINEWGYDDGKGYAYRNTKNNRKLADVIVRDYDGNIVPPSQRFNYRRFETFYQTVYAGSDAEAEVELDRFKNQDIINLNDGFTVRFGRRGRDKMLSKKARDKSIANGFTQQEHSTAAANAPYLFRHSILLSEAPDRNNDPNIVSIKRYGTPIMFAGNRKEGVAQFLIKETVEHGNKLYSIELLGIEKSPAAYSEGRTLRPKDSLLIILPSGHTDSNTTLFQNMTEEQQQAYVREAQDFAINHHDELFQTMDFGDSEEIKGYLSRLMSEAAHYTDYNEFHDAVEWTIYPDDDLIAKAWYMVTGEDPYASEYRESSEGDDDFVVTEEEDTEATATEYTDDDYLKVLMDDAKNYTNFEDFRTSAEWIFPDDSLIERAWRLAKDPNEGNDGTGPMPEKSLLNPDRSATSEEEKDRQFIEIISTDKGFQEWVDGIRAAVHETGDQAGRDTYEIVNNSNAVAPLLVNFIYQNFRKSQNMEKRKKAIASAKGILKANPTFYRDLYAIAEDDDYWRSLYGDGIPEDIINERPEEFARLSTSGRQRLAQHIRNERLRKSILSGSEKYGSEDLKALIKEQDEAIAKGQQEVKALDDQLKDIRQKYKSLEFAKYDLWQKVVKQDEILTDARERLADLSSRIAARASRDFGDDSSISQQMIDQQKELASQISDLMRQQESYLRKLRSTSIEKAVDNVRTAEHDRADKRVLKIEQREFDRREREAREQERRDYIQFWKAYIQKQDEAYYNAERQRTRDERQAYVDYWKNRTAREHEEFRLAWLKARERRIADQRVSDQYQKDLERMRAIRKDRDKKLSDLKEKYKERDALRAVNRHKEDLAKSIMREPSKGVDLIEADKIRAIQALIDPAFRRGMRIDGKMWDIDTLKAMFRGEVERDPVVFNSLSETQLERLSKKDLNEWTLEELESMALAVKELTRQGLQRRQMKVNAERARIQRFRDMAMSTIAGSGKFKEPPVHGSSEERDEERSFLNRMRSAYHSTINWARKSQILDGDKKGVFYKLLVDMKRDAEAAEFRMMTERMRPVRDYIKKNKIDESRFYEKFSVDFDGRKYEFRYTDLVYIYLSQNNVRNRDAVAYGLFVSQHEKDTIKRAVEEEIVGAGRRLDEARSKALNDRIRALGDSRYESVLGQAESIIKDESRRDLFEVVRLIEADFNSDLFERLRRAMAEVYNIRVENEDYYLPINRKDFAGSQPGEVLKQDLLNQIPGYASVNTGMTKDRQEISPYWQKPINIDFFTVWQQSVYNQEHALSHIEYVRLLKGVFQNKGSEALRAMISSTYGRNMVTSIEDHINQIANPQSFTKKSGVDSIYRFLRGALYSSYLGFRASSMVLQAITSPAPFLGAVNPLELAQGYFTVLGHPLEMWEEIQRLSPFMAQRSYHPIIEWMKTESQRGDLSKPRRVLMNIEDKGMTGLEYVDRYAVAGGWWAIYTKERNRLLNEGTLTTEAEIEKAAAKVADDYVQETQPQSNITELSPMFQSRSEAAAILTQFQASLNVIWQNVTYDIPTAIKNKEYARAIGMSTGYILAGALLYMVQQGFDDDDEDDEKLRKLLYGMTTQITSGVPLVSDLVDNTLEVVITGETNNFFSSSAFPAVDKLMKAVQNTAKQNYGKALENFTDSMLLFSGLPYSGGKEAFRLFGIGDKDGSLGFYPGELAGRRHE